MSVAASRLRFLALVLFEAVAVGVLTRAGQRTRLPAGLDGTWFWTHGPIEAVVTEAARLAGLGCAGWLLASTVLYALARASRVPAALRAVEWVTLPAVRRLADRAAAAVLIGSSLAGA
ncbi:MAG: hypothetical protein H0V05_21425, partial [Euzebyaceae bacterium]|nr:hypothetical protein [Euzebyaceae bacterium]